jgi:hypothetical protein
MAFKPFLATCALGISTTFVQAQTSLSEYTENVLTHIVLHELGHALIR